jgi:SAM-dependent MidA family methyltransferase
LHPENIESRETMPEGPITGIVLANELLDNIPSRMYAFKSPLNCLANLNRLVATLTMVLSLKENVVSRI